MTAMPRIGTCRGADMTPSRRAPEAPERRLPFRAAMALFGSLLLLAAPVSIGESAASAAPRSAKGASLAAVLPVADIEPGYPGSHPSDLTAVGDDLYFA